MNSKSTFGLSFKLFEKKYLASRITCLILIAVLSLNLVSDLSPLTILVSFGVIVLLAIQFVIQIKWANWLIGVLIFLASIYFSLAVLSEFNEFEVLTTSAWSLLVVGGGMCLGGFTLSVLILTESVKDFIYE